MHYRQGTCGIVGITGEKLASSQVVMMQQCIRFPTKLKPTT